MKKTILFSSIICASGLTMVGIYNTIIDAARWTPTFQRRSKQHEIISNKSGRPRRNGVT
jgi:hypothetical protein